MRKFFTTPSGSQIIVETCKPKVIVTLSPQVIRDFFKVGRVFSFKVKNGVPPYYELVNYGFDVDRDCFYLIFAVPDCPEGTTPHLLDAVWEFAPSNPDEGAES